MLLQLVAFLVSTDHLFCSIVTPHVTLDMGIAHTETNKLPLDPLFSIIRYLLTNDIHSLMRSCKFYFSLCIQYIHQLLSVKFHHLLTENDLICIQDLMKIPLIDSIKLKAPRLLFYLGKNRTSSIYIGLVTNTNNAFISFWIQTIEIKQRSRIITFVFNETGIDSIYMSSQRLTGPFYYYSRSHRIASATSDSNYFIEAIGELLLSGQTNYIPRYPGTWCLNDKWALCMVHQSEKPSMCSQFCTIECVFPALLVACSMLVAGVLIIAFMYAG